MKPDAMTDEQIAFIYRQTFPVGAYVLNDDVYRFARSLLAAQAAQLSKRTSAENASVRFDTQAAQPQGSERDQYKAAYIEWQEKTEWVQKTAKPNELGMHRADVLRNRIRKLEKELATQAQPVAGHNSVLEEAMRLEPGK
jgi:Arc/MetJ-type ribon-helix-helix transcriptional regulator